MWYDDLPDGKSWTTLWAGYVRCPVCSGIRTLDDPCDVCGANLPTGDEMITLPDDSEMPIGITLMGGERAYEDYIYLGLLQREWNRIAARCPSPRTVSIHHRRIVGRTDHLDFLDLL